MSAWIFGGVVFIGLLWAILLVFHQTKPKPRGLSRETQKLLAQLKQQQKRSLSVPPKRQRARGLF